MTDHTTTKLTAEEFFELPESNLPTELIEGEVIVSPSPVPLHQRVVIRLFRLLDPLATTGEILLAPLSVMLDAGNVLEPDVMWIAENSRCVVTDKYVLGAPDLVVEVLSPSTGRRDRGVKFRLYEKHGTREYWLVDPEAQFIEVWRRDGDRLTQLGVFGPDEMFQSPLLNVEIQVTAVFTV